ncbi:MAG: phospholipid carrier-dependent glycosyltransferase [Candidatus Coatesbacteria bacterium]|nr:MAG: phospholipid carrier-dependent glycosyltransferase [Candidatus Coatesbacteria bacterium]
MTRADFKVAAALFLTFLGLYGLAAPGHFYLLDSQFKLTWAENVVHRGQLHFDRDQVGKESRIGTYFYVGRDDNLYIHFPLGSLFCMLPPAAVGAAAVALVPSWEQYDVAYSLAAANNIPWAAATVVLLFWFGRRLGLSHRRAGTAAVVLGVATPLFPYATFGFNEPVAAFFALLAAACLVVGWERPSAAWPVAAGLALGFAFTIRYELLAFAAAAGAVGLVFLFREPRKWPRVLAFALSFGAVAAVVPLWNWYARGSASNFAYNTLPFFTNLIRVRFAPLEGGGPFAFAGRFAWVYFLSPNMHNVIIYCPLALVGVLSTAALVRAYGRRMLFLVVPALGLAAAVLFTTYSSWAWGLRYAVVFWIILAAAAVVAPRLKRWRRALFGAAVAWGIALAAAAVVADYQLTQHDVAVEVIGDAKRVNYREWIPEGRTNPRYSQILRQLGYAPLAAVRTVDYYVHGGELRWFDRPPPGMRGDERALLDIWPVYAQVRCAAPAAAVWPPYLLLLIGTVAAARWLRGLLRAAP